MPKTEITKGMYKLMVWGLLILGLIINAIFYTLLTWAQIGTTNLQYVGFLAIGCIMIGFGMGLATSRAFKIEGID